VLAPFGIEAQHPDVFLCDQMKLAPELFCAAVSKVRARLKHPPYSVEAYLEVLSRQGLVATVGGLEEFAGSL